MSEMNKIASWIASEDAVEQWASVNGADRGDNYDVVCCRSARTGRYIVLVGPPTAWTSVYVADTGDGARAVAAAGYTPGNAPGAYTYIRAPGRLREVRS